MPYKLPDLAYAFDELEPYIDLQTMQIYYGRHHQGYISKLNDALAGLSNFQERTIEEILLNLEAIPQDIRTTVKNNGGGHYNHSLFWRTLKPRGGGEPNGELAEAIKNKFGNFPKFMAEFTKTSVNYFGSGWCWLVSGNNGEVEIIALPNHDCPISFGQKPLLVLDLWEHAYYLKYQNRRPEYIAAWWNIINWEQVQNNFDNTK
jgi:Fe-Mn family superoxide dismutase